MHANEFTSDLVLEEDGTMLVLYSRKGGDHGYSLTRCNGRGEPLERLRIKDCPQEFVDRFTPDSLTCRNGHIYLVDKSGMKAVVTDSGGRFIAGYFITADSNDSNEGSSIESFSIDEGGRMSFRLSCQSRPVVISLQENEPSGVTCSLNQPREGLTLGLIAFIGLFVSCYLIQ